MENLSGAPGESRTPDHLVRSQVLYPTELRAHVEIQSKQITLVEREGFEPSMGFNAHTPLAGERLQPLGHLSGIFIYSLMGNINTPMTKVKYANQQKINIFYFDSVSVVSFKS